MSTITVRQVGEMYGMEPDRQGMVCGPFHFDSDPSMKLKTPIITALAVEPMEMPSTSLPSYLT